MESLAAFPNGEWDSFNKLISIEDQLDFSHQIFHQFSFPLEHNEGLSFINHSSFFPNLEVNENFFHYNSLETYDLSDSDHIAVTNDVTNSFAMEESTINVIQDLRTDVVLANSISTDNTKKRPRASKGYKNVQNTKRNRKNNVNGNEGQSDNIGVDHGQSSSPVCSSEDENVSQDINGVTTSDLKGSTALNLNGKTRASRGSGTDPQSLYARKRRERINERLRILQNLVPNGTKVDISTMLEEAVHYVKFLQLQIKLLSSDDLWMYAPIAYNGVDVGLNKKIFTLL